MKTNARGFGCLLAAQFFGAFNDNAWKLIVTFLAIRSVEAGLSGKPVAFQEAVQHQTTLAFCVLTLPLMLFSLPAAVLADRVSKRSIIVSMKAVEIALMAGGAAALLIRPDSALVPLVILGLMGAQSALFSPAKYGILPEMLPHRELTRGNALLEMWSFLAIILGTGVAGALLAVSGARPWLAGLLLAALAAAGFLFSLRIPKIAAARSEGQPAETISSAWRAVRGERVLGLAVAGSVVYWTIASLLGQNILVYTRSVLQQSEALAGAPLALFGIGVGAGSLLTARLSGEKVEYGLIPLGAILMCGTGLALWLLSPGFGPLLAFMVVLGVASGFLVVPINALIQWRSPEGRRGAVIALANVFVFTGIFVGSISATLLASAGFSPSGILLWATLALAAGTAWSLWLLPDALLRLGLILLTHTFYRLTVLDSRHVPRQGGALLAPNHVSFVDALMLIASLDRPVRFVVEQVYFDFWLFKPFMKSLDCIPISSSGGPRVILRALRRAGEHLDEGDLVCIFPEGQLTRTGLLNPFRRGLERITRNRTSPVIPVYLDRLWGSIFSREGGRFLTKIPHRIPYPVTVAFGEPLAPETSISEVRQAVQTLASPAWTRRRQSSQPLHRAFVSGARRAPLALAFADATRPRVSRLKALAGAVALARELRRTWTDQRQVGILLPPTVAGVLVNLAASLSGRASVNLNYTAGRAGMESALAQAGIRSLVTSRTFLEKAGLELPAVGRTLFVEDLAIGPARRLAVLLAACLFPARLLERFCGCRRRIEPDDVVTVIFSSGSTGEPKGVMLTHFNIGSNVDGITQVLRATSEDRTLGILPLFHSFGYMCFWFAAQKGLAMPLHPSPLDAPAIGEMVSRYRVTILPATPTFLQLYMRRCTPAQFGSLRLVLTGAEKLSTQLALGFEDNFGLRPLEGYGATECSAVIAVSVPDFRAAGFFQPGSRRGFVGQPLPGVAVKILDPDTKTPLPAGAPGLLLVRGPNVMKGYVGRNELTRRVLRDGWYDTGDIALLNEDGFLKITDRLSRFSKIGGEMVPHGGVEQALQRAAGADHQVFAVTSVPDARKGESLAVIHTWEEERIPELLEKLAGMGLPNLFIPRRDRFLKVRELPVLGSGKVNLKELKRLAQEQFGN